MGKGISKAVEAAVRAAQLHAGSTSCRITDAQRLYTRMNRAIASLAKRYKMSEQDARDQIVGEARRRGPICPVPGKDI